MRNFRDDFPFFKNNPELVYLDSAATSHKPESVIKAISDFYTRDYASAHRGIYRLAEKATEQYEKVRVACARFVAASSEKEVVFTKSATEGINIVAQAWAASALKPGDEIVLTEIEHHANIVPWQLLAQRHGLVLQWIPFMCNGTLDYHAIDTVITKKTKLVALTLFSNVLGNVDALVPDIYKNGQSFLNYVISRAKATGAKVLVDAAQWAPHYPLNVQELGCDFAVFSAHKMLGPQGLGILYIKKDIHHEINVYQGGGGVVSNVGRDLAAWKPVPYLLEAGTHAVAQVIGFGAALTYLTDIVGFQTIQEREQELFSYLISGLQSLSQIRLLTCYQSSIPAQHCISFNFDRIHAHDVAAYLDTQNICVRAGNHCAQILHKKLKIAASVRVSFYFYNTVQEIDYLLEVLQKFSL
jgi:cysteine desulfurase / selenocysteine lyase